ncbi:MAG: cupredoxin [Cystobacter sp.]
MLLTTGLLIWEVLLLALLSGGYGARLETVGPRLARDAGLLLPVWLAVLAGARGLSRRGNRRHSDVHRAALLAVGFLLLMSPVAIVRNVLQRQLTPASARPGMGSPSLSAEPGEDDGRFLCAVASPDLSTPEETQGEVLADAAWAGLQEALLLQVPVLPLALLLVRRRQPGLPGLRRTWLQPGAPMLVLAAIGLSDGARRADPGAPTAGGTCHPGAPVRTYAVSARSADLLLNLHGEHVPQGLRYVLDEALPEGPETPARPLVLRANLGECLHLRFTNRLDEGPASLHLGGLNAVLTETPLPGRFVPSPTVRPGQHLTYVVALPEEPEAEGAYLLHDPEDGGAREARGLFGALILEPAGSRYRDASTGEPLSAGAGGEALIDPPSGASFREMVLLAHGMGPPEEADVRSAGGHLLPVQDEMAGPFRPGAYGLNYRSLPLFERDESPEGDVSSSPSRQALAAPLLRSYPGESITLRVVHAGSAEPHIAHVHEWDERGGPRERQTPGTPLGQPHLLMPGERLTLASTPGDMTRPAGDYLVHCHVPNHSSGGERVTWRIFPQPVPHLAPLTPP